jgi:L,D-transpeptidase catalytic domain
MRRAFVCLLVAACGQAMPADDSNPADLPLGDRLPDDEKADGNWGAALTCKAAPNLPSLVSPRITISLDGLTLHLTDDATGYDQVFPVGVGAIESDQSSANYGESKSYEPLLGGRQDYAITPSSIQPCKFWWTDPDTGVKQPVFAGLPFMSWNGPYAVHGPIDNFRAPNGGSLRRGFVSHGCIRMEAADVLEVYARIKSVRTPVHIQREPERLDDGSRADVPNKWVGAECEGDSDCNFTGGMCAHNDYSDRGFCTMRCTSTCPDRAGQPGTFCVADPQDATRGLCVSKMSSVNQDCRPYDHFVQKTLNRFKQSVIASVCVPGSPGWVGDHCLAASDCRFGTSCSQGICTESCGRYCPDEPGWPSTFCAADGNNECLRTCTPASNASECPADSDCVQRSRVSDSGTVKYVCVPR